MLILTKDNVADYVASRLDFFNPNGCVTISAVGDGTSEDDGDGFINFVFRVSDGEHKLIVKQATETPRCGFDMQLNLDRYRLEYRSMQLRKAIVPDLLPDLYDIDHENKVFITEDVSHLQIARFQLMKGKTYPLLADQMARYMAATEFYTSEYYLEGEEYRGLGVYFTNSKMRSIMDNGMFLTKIDDRDTVSQPLDPEFITFSKRVCANPAIRLQQQKLRHLFMSKGECLIHGDLHTSNIFAGEKECKVIDMEYTFCGPFSYDLGYFLANFLSQYEAAVFRPFNTEEERRDFKAYCLYMIKATYEKFCDYFISYCHEDAKPEYKNIAGLDEDFRLTTLREFLGFAATAQLCRISKAINYPDYDGIEDYVQRHNAKCLSIIVDAVILAKWEHYESIDEFIDDLLVIEDVYCENIKDLEY